MSEIRIISLTSALQSSKSILVCVGAGISVNAGIPDFRSPESGIYSQISDPDDLFHIENYQEDPIPFYKLCQWIFARGVESIKPTITHEFIAKLRKSGKLLRCYTQNVDGLEVKAGLRLGEDVVQCHGNFDRISCCECRAESRMSPDMWREEVVKFLNTSTDDPSRIPSTLRCNQCGGFLKPSVVMFGEPLPQDFFSQISQDIQSCDLVLIIGTSLQVYPFASIPKRVHSDIPQFLITKGGTVAPPNVTIIDDDCDVVFSLVSKRM
jgi:NAD-dependent SIR2 family protein deacetylase